MPTRKSAVRRAHFQIYKPQPSSSAHADLDPTRVMAAPAVADLADGSLPAKKLTVRYPSPTLQESCP